MRDLVICRLLAVVFLVNLGSGSVMAETYPLNDWAWQHRLLVIVSPSGSDSRLRVQRDLLADVRKSMLERDMAVAEIVGDKMSIKMGPKPSADAAALKGLIRNESSAFEVVLFGKDTGIKLRSSEPITPQSLFALIDIMPMRREEIRQRSR